MRGRKRYVFLLVDLNNKVGHYLQDYIVISDMIHLCLTVEMICNFNLFHISGQQSSY